MAMWTTGKATRFGELDGDTIIIKGANRRIKAIPLKGELTTKVIISPKFKLTEDITGKIIRRTNMRGRGDSRIYHNKRREGKCSGSGLVGHGRRLYKAVQDGTEQ